MNAVGRSLKGVAADIKLVSLPGVPEKGDVADFIALRGESAATEW